MLAPLIQSFLSCHKDLTDYLKGLFQRLLCDVLEQVATDYRLNPAELKERYVGKTVAQYLELEVLQVDPKAKCRGKCKDGKPCGHTARPNGFCKLHEGQYEDVARQERFRRHALERRIERPTHTHPPCPGVFVEGCPACAEKQAKMQKLKRRFHDLAEKNNLD